MLDSFETLLQLMCTVHSQTTREFLFSFFLGVTSMSQSRRSSKTGADHVPLSEVPELSQAVTRREDPCLQMQHLFMVPHLPQGTQITILQMWQGSSKIGIPVGKGKKNGFGTLRHTRLKHTHGGVTVLGSRRIIGSNHRSGKHDR